MANLLAFYFDPRERHGLGDTFIRALLQTNPKHLYANKDVEEFLSTVESIGKHGFSDAKVVVEDSTDDNKRLDILIETDKLVIAIEFKINNYLNNPLKSYVERVSTKYPEKKKCYFVLTPQWKEPIGAALKGNTEFKQIILSHFIEKVEMLVKEEGKFTKPDDFQLMLYNDFLNTIENRKIRINMINGYFDKIKKGDLSSEQIENAFKQFNELKGHFEKEMDELLKLLHKNSVSSFSVLSTSKAKIESVAYCKKGDMQIKIRLNLDGWAIERWKKVPSDWIKVKTEKKPYGFPLTELVKEVESNLNSPAQPEFP